MDITPFLDQTSKQPLYIQIYKHFKKQIENNKLHNKPLPSIRSLCTSLNVSKSTVDNAYQQLVAEGYIVSKEKRGFFVSPFDMTLTNKQEVQPYVEQTKNEEVHISYDFKYGNIDLEHFPYKIWHRCMKDAFNNNPKELFYYGTLKGHNGLREAIRDYLYHARGVTCTTEQIVVCAGTEQAVQTICHLLSISSVALENPGYNGVRSVFQNNGCLIAPIDLEHDGINMKQLEQQDVDAAFITPSHQFPMGMVLPIHKRIQLLQWASRNHTYIIEDDYDSEFRYQGQPIPALKALDKEENVIYLGTFSKSFLPASRVSYMVLPSSLLPVFDKLYRYYSQPTSPIMQEALYLFLKNGHFERHIRKMRTAYNNKHKVLVDAINTYMQGKVEIIGQKAGLHLLLKCQPHVSFEQLDKLAQNIGVKVYSPKEHWIHITDEQIEEFILIGFGGLSETEIIEGIEKLSKVWLNHFI